MNANIVLAGGGVKGAVLGGCLLAAERVRIEGVGFGGTSAGSIVALLASVGYSGDELKEVLLELDLAALLDDGGKELDLLKAVWNRLCARMAERSCLTLLSMKELAAFFSNRKGLYRGAKLRQFLADAIGEKVLNLPKAPDGISFDELVKCGCHPLRIVATDVLRRRAVVFGAGRKGGDQPVVDAVLASASFPFVFEPIALDDMLLTDGGLSSNLPAFLFEREYREARTPTLAFDLVPPNYEPNPGGVNWKLDAYGQGLLSSALEASDVLLREATPGVHYFPIRTPVGIDTLDFKLTRAQRESCFAKGYEEAAGLLSEYEPVRRGQQFGDELQKRMIAQFGPVRLYLPVLRALLDQLTFASGKSMVGARAHIMLLTGKATANSPSTRIIVYQIGMDDDGDSDLELNQAGGCSGLAWDTGQVTVADLGTARADPGPWRMSQQQHNKVPKRIKSMISVAIPGSVHAEKAPERPVGTLSVDCCTDLENTGWCTDVHFGFGVGPDQQPEVKPDIATLMGAWATVVGAMLP